MKHRRSGTSLSGGVLVTSKSSYIVVSAVSNKILDALSCLRVHLYLVKDDKRLTLIQLHAVVGGQQHEERIKIVNVLGEIVLDLVGALGEVDEDIALIFIFAEFFAYR